VVRGGVHGSVDDHRSQCEPQVGRIAAQAGGPLPVHDARGFDINELGGRIDFLFGASAEQQECNRTERRERCANAIRSEHQESPFAAAAGAGFAGAAGTSPPTSRSFSSTVGRSTWPLASGARAAAYSARAPCASP